jgi:cell division protein ZapA
LQLRDLSYIVGRYLLSLTGTERIINMAESLESVEINVLGRAYRVSCQPEQYMLLRQAAQKLDDALGDLRIRARGSSNEQLAIMVALNLSHELLLEKNRIQQYSESMERRIRQLNDVIQDALKEQSKLSVDDCN